jgi:hypothetical protein
MPRLQGGIIFRTRFQCHQVHDIVAAATFRLDKTYFSVLEYFAVPLLIGIRNFLSHTYDENRRADERFAC